MIHEHEQSSIVDVRTPTVEENEEVFFAGTQCDLLSRQARLKAIAMIDTPRSALLRTCALRRIDASGMRRELIVRICMHHDQRNQGPISGTRRKSKGDYMY